MITNKLNKWKNNVETVIQSVRNKYGFLDSFSMNDFFSICETENIKVLDKTVFDLSDFPEIKGLLFKDSAGQNYIYLQSSNDIFTAFHELGHFFLGHRGISFSLDKGIVPIDTIELEADYFAELAIKGDTTVMTNSEFHASENNDAQLINSTAYSQSYEQDDFQVVRLPLKQSGYILKGREKPIIFINSELCQAAQDVAVSYLIDSQN